MPIPVVLLMRNPVGFRNVIDLGNSHRLKRRTLVLLPCDLKDKTVIVKANGAKQNAMVVDIHVGQQRRRLRSLRMRRNSGTRKAVCRCIAQNKYKLEHHEQQQGFGGKAIGNSGKTGLTHGTSKLNDYNHRDDCLSITTICTCSLSAAAR